MRDIHRSIQIFRVPFGLGSRREGTERSLEHICEWGLLRQIKNLNIPIAGDTRLEPSHSSREADHSGGKTIKHLEQVRQMCASVAAHVSDARAAGNFPLILGGDRTVSVGAIAGVAHHTSNLGMIWFDAHACLHTEHTIHSGSAGDISLASLLGMTNVLLPEVSGFAPSLNKKKVVLIGLRDVDPEEREWILAEGITYFSMHEIDRMGIQKVIEAAMDVAGQGTDGIHVSFSADCLDPLEAPGVEVPVPGGLSYREAHFALELLAASGQVISMDVTEVNELLDHNRQTAKLMVGLIASTLGKRIM